MAAISKSTQAMSRFNATASLRTVRSLHMTPTMGNPSNLLSKVAENSKASEPESLSQTTRHFNTSRSLKFVNDSSTIEFAYMPQIERHSQALPEIDVARIPRLPDNYSSSSNIHEVVAEVVRPTISTVSADSTNVVSAMTEVVDNHAASIDHYDLTNKVSIAASKLIEEVKKEIPEPGLVKDLWNGLLDDVFGSKKAAKAL